MLLCIGLGMGLIFNDKKAFIYLHTSSFWSPTFWFLLQPLEGFLSIMMLIKLISWQVKLDEDETSSFRERLLPLIIGLLRTVKL